MESTVYFASIRSRSDKDSKVNKIRRLFDAAGFSEVTGKGDLTAIKLHFGERGNDSYVSPVLVRQIVDKAKALGAKPFLTDTNTLYGGSRANSVDHLTTAIEHGFDYAVAGAPLIIADGLNSDYYYECRNQRKALQIGQDCRRNCRSKQLDCGLPFQSTPSGRFRRSSEELGDGLRACCRKI